MIRTRTKIEAVLAVAFLLAISISSVFAVTRTISDTQDTVDTYIRNSNGKYWAATGANLQLAINDLTSGGTVWLPSGITTITTDLTMKTGVTLKGNGKNSTTLKLGTASTTTRVIYCHNINNFTICDFSINGNNDSVTDNYQAIVVSGCYYFNIYSIFMYKMYRAGLNIDTSYYGHIYDVDVRDIDDYPNTQQPIAIDTCAYLTFENIHINSSGIIAQTKDVSGFDMIRCSWSHFTDILVDGVGMAFNIKIAGNNNLTFSNILIRRCTNVTQDYAIACIVLVDSNFENINIGNALGGIQITSGGQRLNFNNIIIHNSVNAGFWISGDFININNAQIYNPTDFGLYMDGCDDSKFSNIEIYSSAGDAIDISNGDRDSFINCKLTSNAISGIYGAANTFFNIDSCIFTSNGGDAIDLVDATVCNNFTISNCLFTANAKAIDIAATANYFIVNGCICQIGDGIDINAARTLYRRVNDTICTLTES